MVKVCLPLYFQKKYRALLEGLFSLAAIGVAFIGFRIYFMGNKPPEFAPADNPASDSDSLLTRVLTYYYLPFLNFWLLLFPKVLSFDWSMGAVPLVETMLDLRNMCTLTFYGLLVYIVYCLVRYLNVDEVSDEKHHANCNGNGIAHHTVNNSSAPHPPANHANTKLPGIRKRPARRGSTSSTDSSHSNSEDCHTIQSRHAGLGYQQNLQVLTLALAILIIPFVPATNLFFYVGFVIAERVLYIPSMGFCLLVSQGAYVMQTKYFSGEQTKRHLLHMVLVCLIASYSVRTVIRNQDWQTEENLYRAGIYVNPAKG